jgi:hypothetical protein
MNYGPDLLLVNAAADVRQVQQQAKIAGVFGLASMGLAGLTIYFLARGKKAAAVASGVAAGGSWFIGHQWAKQAAAMLAPGTPTIPGGPDPSRPWVIS